MNIWIIYDSKYGNNQKIAEALAGHFKDGNAVHVQYAKEISQQSVIDGGIDVLLFGGPLRLGMLSRTMKSWANNMVRMLTQKGVQLKKAAVWGTHIKDPPNAQPKFTWDVIKQKWKDILDIVPAAKKAPEIESFVVGPVNGRDTVNPGWEEIVARFAETIKNL